MQITHICSGTTNLNIVHPFIRHYVLLDERQMFSSSRPKMKYSVLVDSVYVLNSSELHIFWLGGTLIKSLCLCLFIICTRL